MGQNPIGRDADPVAASAGPPADVSLELAMGPESAHDAREVAHELLARWRIHDERVCYDVLLLTSELVTNAVRHGAGRIRLHMSLKSQLIEVSVDDGSPLAPQRPLHVADAVDRASDLENGRGMLIVAAVAQQWGVDPLPDGGKRVWVQIPCPPPTVPEQRKP